MPKELKIGELAEVIDFEGNRLDRRIVGICGNLVFVCTDQELAAAKEEGRDPITIGWPMDAVAL